MFTGIIETLGEVVALEKEKGNVHLSIRSNFTDTLKVDQSIAHNGVCLTVVAITDDIYTVTVIAETLSKTNIGMLNVGDFVNLERGMLMSQRLDGHIVQGHVDQTAICTCIKEDNGSRRFTFSYDKKNGNITIEKGSITINGVSLTVVNSEDDSFSVAIIPYTLKNTTFQSIKEGDIVNIEFDVIGKYIAKMYSQNQLK